MQFTFTIIYFPSFCTLTIMAGRLKVWFYDIKFTAHQQKVLSLFSYRNNKMWKLLWKTFIESSGRKEWNTISSSVRGADDFVLACRFRFRFRFLINSSFYNIFFHGHFYIKFLLWKKKQSVADYRFEAFHLIQESFHYFVDNSR